MKISFFGFFSTTIAIIAGTKVEFFIETRQKEIENTLTFS